jgi:hypothetical protein
LLFFCFFLSCVPFFASFSGLFILDCPSVFSNVYCNSHTDHTTTYLSFTICQWLYLRYALVETTNKQKLKHNTICGGHYYTQTNRNNVDKTFTSPHTNNWR